MCRVRALWGGRLSVRYAVFLFVVSCAVPDVGSIDLSSCVRVCADVLDACLTRVDEELRECPDAGDECREDKAGAAHKCLSEALDCVSVCVEDAERVLKE